MAERTIGHPDRVRGLIITTVGWPMPAMRVGYYQATDIYGTNPVGEARSPAVSWGAGLTLVPESLRGFKMLDRFALPVEPLWPGFAINSALCGLLLFAAWRTAGIPRRALRRRRGRCPACGYDRAGLGVSTPCPECGRPPRA